MSNNDLPCPDCGGQHHPMDDCSVKIKCKHLKAYNLSCIGDCGDTTCEHYISLCKHYNCTTYANTLPSSSFHVSIKTVDGSCKKCGDEKDSDIPSANNDILIAKLKDTINDFWKERECESNDVYTEDLALFLIERVL